MGRERGARYNISRAYNTMLNGVFGMNLKDNKSGFICCSREVMADMLTHKGKYYYWQSFVMVAAHAKGYSYKEVETLFEPRRQGVPSWMAQPLRLHCGASTTSRARRLSTASKPSPRDLADQFLRSHHVMHRKRSHPLLTLPAGAR